MKIFAFAFAILVAGVAANPEAVAKTNERFVDNIIAGLIEDLINDIQERGLDPIEIKEADYEYRLPVTDLLEVDAAAADILVEGISNIKINRINFSLLTSRLQLDLSLPLVSAKVGSSSARVKLFDGEFAAEASGSVAIEELRLVADVRINLGIISGVSIRSLAINFSIKDIQSDLNIVLFGHDLSEKVNGFLGETVPNTLEANRNDINSLLSHVLKEVIEAQLP
ncbi:hypothetical protein ABMA28_011755 [Loxostege sticticalis]|uniref:Uncharacterized protein n=1 Tax=Loxostege sticticalis TaxID=481309 RepID=A0ABD0TKJ8_LOXSC